MNLTKKHARHWVWLSFAFALASCGGGGGSNSSGNVPPPPPPPPQTQFADVTSSSGINFSVEFSKKPGDEFNVPYFAGGVASGDYDDDGDIDLFVVRGDIGPNLLYRNDGDNVFVEVAAEAGLAFTKSATENYRHSGPMFADMDGDGDLDLFLGGIQGDPCRIFANNGDGTFVDVTAGSGLDSMGAPQNVSAAFGDYDMDGDLDMLVAHWGTQRPGQDPGDTEHLWRNESTPAQIRFVSVSVEAGLSPSIITLPDPYVPEHQVGIDYSFAPSFTHLNDDLYPDIVMSADVNLSMAFMNNGDGTFSNITDVEVIRDANGMGSTLGDYDNDGDLDWFVTSIYRGTNPLIENGNRLYRNDAGIFVDVTETAGVANGGWGWAACFVDLNNDGNLDLYHTNGWQFDDIGDFTADTSRAFISNGDGTFTNEAFSLGIADKNQGRGVVCADFDRDGDIDIFLWSNNEGVNAGSLYRNDTSDNNYVDVKLRGLPPNTAAAGARIRATVGNVTQMREVSIGSNFISQNPTEQHFGIGQAPQIDSLVIEWPDGVTSDLGIVQANQRIV
ncbi:MAG: CRTAC1 family protein, partial [Proteobacteria bacterium]|nr:CRTAC1 family protein [Pseudomonadota bacterium]